MSLPGTTPGLPVERATTLPAPWYFDRAHHGREVDRIVKRTWQQIAPASRLRDPGDYVTADIAGEPVVVVRGRDGAVRAFYNVCRHRAGAVAEGEGCVKAFSCSYHGWAYGLDGALLAAPEMEQAREFAKERFGLVPIACATWGSLVFVNLDPEAAPLLEALGSLPERARATAFPEMEFRLRVPYTIACNWKVYVDNYLEGYHIPRAHPGLNRVMDYAAYTVEPDGRVVVQGGAGRDAGDPSRYLYLWLWPGFMINVSPAYGQTNVILPLGPESTLCVFDYFFPEGVSDATVEAAVAWSDEIQREDIRLCETVQRNLRSSSYVAGRYSPKRENGVYHFHEMVRRAMA